MIDVDYTKTFLKDLKKLKNTSEFHLLYEFCFESLANLDTIKSITGIKKLKGYDIYYRKRIGNYRIGFKYSGNKLTFMRVMNRKDIYKKFP